MKKHLLAVSACLTLGIYACSDRETPPPPAGDVANGRAEAPIPDTIPPPMNEPAPVADSDVAARDSRTGMGATSSSERSTTYRSRSVVKSKRTKHYNRGDDTYASNRDRRDHDGYTETRGDTSSSDGMNTGSTNASSDAGYSTRSDDHMVGRHNPAAINSGF